MTDNALMILETSNPQELFVMNGLDAFINKIKEEVADAPKDISTDRGRKEIASLAYKVAKSKKALEELGKKSIEDLQKTVKAVTAERIRGVNALQEIQDNIRKPLTQWEEAEKSRIAAHESNITKIQTFGFVDWMNGSLQDFNQRLEELLKLSSYDWQEFNFRAADEITKSEKSINEAIIKRTAYDAEQAELKRLREEQTAREQKERDEKIAAEAAEKAKLEAERIAKENADRQEREKQEAVARAEKAEAERIAAEKKAEEEKLAAAAKAEKEKQEAIEAEKKRQADEAAKLAAETAKREADTEHKAKINDEIFTALMHIITDDTTNKQVITAIANGLIPHVKINY